MRCQAVLKFPRGDFFRCSLEEEHKGKHKGKTAGIGDRLDRQERIRILSDKDYKDAEISWKD